MSNQLKRYQQSNVIEHLASQYVLGHLSEKAKRRTEQLRRNNQALDNAIMFWQEQLVHLDEHTLPHEVYDTSWQNIANKLNLEQIQNEDIICTDHSLDEFDTSPVSQTTIKPNEGNKLTSLWHKFFTTFASLFNVQVLTQRSLVPAFSFACLCLVSYVSYVSYQPTPNDPLSYVAVLTNDKEEAHLVATTYGESKKLLLSIVEEATVDDDQSLELWVVSKSDGQARSLGILPKEQLLVEQQLTQPQWRLIKDSLSLIITVEELGGSALGEPSEQVVSRGLCVRLKEWNTSV
jgi:anti-sigma-K factor RskA